MPKSLADLRRHLSRVKPWVAVAALLAIALLGYYAILGMRYMDASGEVTSLNSQIQLLSRRMGPTPPDIEPLKAELESQGQRLEVLRDLFAYQEADHLVGILADTAQETAVALGQVSVGSIRLEIQEEIKYRIQPMTATVQGESVDIYRFLSLLQQTVPVVSVSSINISGLEGFPSAQVQLLFYLSPEAASEKQETP
ncbi:MAG: hypothetical protein V3U79_03015 [Dehalococcoidia bacterium]